MDGEELLKLSVECYKSLRSKYPARCKAAVTAGRPRTPVL